MRPHAVVSAPLRRPIRRARFRSRFATRELRAPPAAIVIGAQKAGTSSLFAYLTANPAITRPLSKEIHYFDISYHRGIDWYRAHFPTRRHLERLRGRLGSEALSIEATPYYLPHPLAPERVHAQLPDAKLIVMLRDPVDRAISHYHHSLDTGREQLPLERAIEREADRLEGEEDRIMTEPGYNSFNHRHFGYLMRGRYAEQLERWFAVLPRNQFLVLDSGELFRDPDRTMRRVCSFLGVQAHSLSSYPALGHRAYRTVDSATRSDLRAYFASHNERLWVLLGERFMWS
jgi:sulfotransferase family protein